ncbi:MAG: hypothetical protein ACT4OI_04845 [Methanobacteriota archaeon]
MGAASDVKGVRPHRDSRGGWEATLREILRTAPAPLIVLVGVVNAFATLSAISSTVDLYFAADAAHYVTDARALLGTGVRELRHAPLFPALVATLLWLGEVPAFQVSMGIALLLLPVGLYFMLRAWLPPVPSLLGAAAASVAPMIGELTGWSGGATLIALDMIAFSLGAMERWVREGKRQGFLVGLFTGLTVLAHPFMATGLLAVLGLRWVAHGVRRRRFRLDWSPLGARGVASFFGTTGAVSLAAAGYYTRLRGATPWIAPDLVRPFTILLWGVRDNALLLFFVVLGLGLPYFANRRSLVVVTGAVFGFSLLVPFLAGWDISYNLRVVYLLPIMIGAGVGLLAHLGWEELAAHRRDPRAEAAIVGALLLAATLGAAAGFGYGAAIRISAPYYQRVHAADLAAFDYLEAGTGTVATSWSDGFYDEGKVNGWFVEGLSNRRAIGSGAPWTWTLSDVGESELDLQRFFAGSVGIENGALQVAASPTGRLADPAIQANVDGFYYPLVYVNGPANAYPVSVLEGATPTRLADGFEFRHAATNGTETIIEEVRLDGSRVTISFRLEGGAVASGDWDVWVWPAYYQPWSDVSTGVDEVSASTRYRPASVRLTVSPLDADGEVGYEEVHPVWGVQAIEVRRLGAPSIAFEVSATGVEAPSDVAIFDERGIAIRHDLTTVLVWRNTGWTFRFEADACYTRAFETPYLVVYEIALACRS